MYEMKDNTGSAWKKEGQNGEYYSGSIKVEGKEYWIKIFSNNYKDKETSPDFNIKLELKGEQEQPQEKPLQQPQEQQHFAMIDEEIPF